MKIKINGMHCQSCEVLIERKIKSINGVKNVRANLNAGEAEIECDSPVDIKKINELINPHGYSVVEDIKNEVVNKHNYQISFNKHHIETIAILIIVTGIYFFLRKFNFIPDIGLSENMGYGLIFLIGLLASVSSCLAVTGGLLLGISAKYQENSNLSTKEKFKPHIYFNIGRILSYALLGGLIGSLGSFLALSGRTTGVLTIIASAVMILIGLQLLKIFPFLNKIQLKMPKFLAHKIYDEAGKKRMPFLMGAATFFLPCGFTQALQIYVLSTGSFTEGALTMLMFSLGTLPGLISIGAITSSVKGNFQRYFLKTAGVVVIMLGLLNISAGVGLTQTSFSSGSGELINNFAAPAQKQIIDMKVVGLDYVPAVFEIKKGIPVEWRIDGSKAVGCAQVLSVPSMGVIEPLPKGIKTLNFIASQEGVIRFSCSMGMAGPGEIRIK